MKQVTVTANKITKIQKTKICIDQAEQKQTNNNLFLLNSGEASTDAQTGVGGGGLGKSGGKPWSGDSR